MELGRFHIEYEPRTAIKGQVLADFIAEFTDDDAPAIEQALAETAAPTDAPLAPTGGEGDGINSAESTKQKIEDKGSQFWTLFIDGSSTRDGSGVGIVLKSPEGSVIEQSVRLGFTASNNESEYEALIVGMKKAKALGVRNLQIHCDSQLVAN